MAESHNLGQTGETLSVIHLENKGFRILDRNWRWGKNEIDIVAENNDIILFIEVKTRNNNYQIHPLKAVNTSKQKSIINTADQYLKKHKINKDSRFDIITIIKNNNGYNIEHIEGAFYPTL